MKRVIHKILEKPFVRKAEKFLEEHKNAKIVQEKQFKKIIKKIYLTNWGIENGYFENMTIDDFQKQTPISTYEKIFPWIQAMLAGQENMLWPGKVEWFSKSSGTTNDKSKYIPMPKEILKWNHFEGGKIMWGLYFKNFNKKSLALFGKAVGIGGSIDDPKDFFDPKIKAGDLSAVLMKNLPFWAKYFRTPNLSIATLPHWETKLEKMAQAIKDQKITNLAGVPTWTLFLIKKIMELKNTNDIKKIWPNLEIFFHGAVAFGPYRETFADLIKPNIKYLELYNASEGFFAIQDNPEKNGEMMLLLGQGIFYEFIPFDQFGKKDQEILTIEKVSADVIYVIVITTPGLIRYIVGDTITFTSLYPFRIKITGRTKHFINAFGEELMVDNADQALAETCKLTGSKLTDYTAGPVYISADKKSGGHEWIIEFETEPKEKEKFIEILDNELQKLNSDYSAKRRADLALKKPILHIARKGTFYNWMEKRGKLGGQNKVPRLSNDRKYLEEILELL